MRQSNPNNVRIISGKWRGSLVSVADIAGLRPTPVRVREMLFNWLQPVIVGSRCLDLFSGSGALGIEAISRGANEVVFIDSNLAASNNIEQSVSRLDNKQDSKYELHHAAAEVWLTQERSIFDIIFIDPPFKLGWLEKILPLVEDGWVQSGTSIYLEYERGGCLPILPENWELKKEKQIGDVESALLKVR